ncbi:hypothetical protein ABIB95_009338, partial [Bradyrhizobium sp. LA2.1]
HASSHGLSGAELIRLPLNALMSNQKDNCNAKLKLVKRQMYGRAKLDLLQARLIGAP